MRADLSERGSECGGGLRRLDQLLRQERVRAERAAPPALALDPPSWQRAALSLVRSLFSPAGESEPSLGLPRPQPSATSRSALSPQAPSPATRGSRSQVPGLSHRPLGPTEAGGSPPEVSILNRAFWAVQTPLGKGTREALRAAVRGTREEKPPDTLPRNENWGYVGGELPQEGQTKEKDQREEGRTRGNGRELRAESRGDRSRVADRARGPVAHAGTGQWMAGLGELGLRAGFRAWRVLRPSVVA